MDQDFKVFYDRVKELKDYYRNKPIEVTEVSLSVSRLYPHSCATNIQLGPLLYANRQRMMSLLSRRSLVLNSAARRVKVASLIFMSTIMHTSTPSLASLKINRPRNTRIM